MLAQAISITKRVALIGAAGMFFALPATAQAQGLQEALRDAYVNSDLLQQRRFVARLADEGVAQQVAGLRPVISLIGAERRDYGVTDLTTQTLTLSADLVLFSSGSRIAAINAARASVAVAREGLRGIEAQVLQDAVSAYMNLWRDVQVVNVRQSNVGVLTEQARAAQDRFELGEDTRTDVAQAQAQLAAARGALAAAQGQLEISRELFRLAIGREPGNLGSPGDRPALPASRAEAEALARSQSPDILAAGFQVDADRHNLTAARAAFGPTISIGATSTDTREGRPGGLGTTEAVTLSITQPLYRGGRLASSERIALANLAASQAGLNRTTAVVLQNLGNAYARLSVAQAQLSVTQEQINAAQLAFEGVREEASLGARTTLDVLNAEQALLEARIARIQAQADLYGATYGVLAATGILSVENLGLEVEAYDAAAYGEAFSGAPVVLRRSVQGERLDAVLDRLNRD